MTAVAENSEPLIIIARAVRLRGLKGEVVADILTDFPERFEQLSDIVGLKPNGDQLPLKLENHWFQKDRVILKFAGYDDVEAAAILVGLEFGLPESQRVKLTAGEFYEWELESCVVENRDNNVVGRVRSVMKTGGVALLVVERDSGGECLIPLAESIVLDVDVTGKRIVIDPPEGLLDL